MITSKEDKYIQNEIEFGMLRTISDALKNHADTYAHCGKCNEVFVDDVLGDSIIFCPRCGKTHELRRRIESE